MKNKIQATMDVVSIDKDQGLMEAMDVMEKKRISHLLVHEFLQDF